MTSHQAKLAIFFMIHAKKSSSQFFKWADVKNAIKKQN